MRELITLVESKFEGKLETTPLSYGLNDLMPVLCKDTLDYHFEHLAKGYAKRYNAGEGDADFNKAGNDLHNKLFIQYQKPKSSNKPTGAVLALINDKFKSYKDFQEAIRETAMSMQGSGWVYLSTSGEIKTIKNHAIRNDIVYLIDMWEHAYAMSYQWDKERYLKNLWRIVNWDIVNSRL